ncbi:hypothetical protein GGF43_000337 [Coemansia sp. RSA 2618]|nr:hypothetical protein GGF43_000337 [Coemansia sp. RSA 2618]
MLDRMRSLVDNVAETFGEPAPTHKERLLESWTRIQEYYTPQRQDDNRKYSVTDTTIPHHMESMLRELAQEILDDGVPVGATAEALAQPLEFGACMEYLLQYHVLSDLVDLAEGDLPRGMRKYVVRFFDFFVGMIPLGLLPESAIRLPLVAIMRQCLQIVETSPRTAVSGVANGSNGSNGATEHRLGRGYHSIMNERAAVVLCHDLLQLIVTLFTRLREHAAMVYLFFDWGSSGSEWPAARALGSGGGSSELAVASLRTASSEYMSQAASGHELFIVHTIVEYLLAPGATGQLAREALVLVVQVLVAPDDAAQFVSFLLDQARVAEVLVEHMGYLHAQMPMFRPVPRTRASAVFGDSYAGPRRMAPLDRRMLQQASRSTAPRVDIGTRLRSLLAQPSVLRARAAQDQREARILAAARTPLEHVDAFFVCWELLDEIAAVAGDARVRKAVQSQLINGFLRTHVEPALLATAASRNQALTMVSYLTDMITATHSTDVLDALFIVLLGPDLTPERAPQPTVARPSMLSPEDQQMLDQIEDDALRAEAAMLLLPPGTVLPGADSGAAADVHPVRAALVSWLTLDDGTHLSLNTLRLFDTILSTMNQFAFTSLVLRNFIDEPLTVEAAEPSLDSAEPNLELAKPSLESKRPSTADSPDAPARSFYSGPALGRGASVAADQELVRAVVERFVDAVPSNIANALPEFVVAAALRLDRDASAGDDDDVQPLEAPQRNLQSMRALIMRESLGCDNYVHDCLLRLRSNAHYTNLCWQDKAQFVRGLSRPRDESVREPVDDALAAFYPGAFLQSLIGQLALVVKRHMAYNLMLTSMLNKLLCIADPALSAYLFLANSATMPSASPASGLFLYDAFVNASADAYVKSERVPQFSVRLTRQLREGVETAVRVGAVHPMAQRASDDQQQPIALNPRRSVSTTPQRNHPGRHDVKSTPRQASGNDDDNTPLALLSSQPSTPTAMDIDATEHVQNSSSSETTAASRNRGDAAAAAAFLGTPIKRFVNGYIVLDEFGKEMAALAMALHTLELDRQMERVATNGHAEALLEDEYADLLEYYDPDEPAYKQALAIRESLMPGGRPPIIELGAQRVPKMALPVENAQEKNDAPARNKKKESRRSGRRRSSRPSADA